MAKRKHNFNAGPAALPLPVLQAAQAAVGELGEHGISLLEMSHRTPPFQAVLDDADAAIRALYGLGDAHEVLFLQGGASLQFAMVPLNLGSGGAYVNTGTWSTAALAEARVVGEAAEVWTDAPGGFKRVPGRDRRFDDLPEGTPYLHYTSNNTINGTQFHHVPEASAPLVADMSSDFMSRPVDLSPFDLVYAGAQKNAGPAGVVVVIARKSVSRGFRGAATVPKILRYVTHAAKGSLYHTPNTFGIFVVGQVARWVLEGGGLDAIAARNARKAAGLYAAIEGNDRFSCHAAPGSRSLMNVTFATGDAALDARFVAEANALGFIGLKGHRSVGGLRASLYNAVPEASVQALSEFIAGWG